MEISIYAAGKIEPHDWRHDIGDVAIYDDNRVPENYGPVPTNLTGARMPDGEVQVTYAGPFFVGCDHSCAHGSDGHGQAGGCVGGDRRTTAENCLAQIRSADIVFAWLDELKPGATQSSAYGTLVEVGYALGIGKPVVVASSRRPYNPVQDDFTAIARHSTDDLWFAWTLAHHRIVADTPRQALERVAREGFTYTLSQAV